jgi:hypothetical protein
MEPLDEFEAQQERDRKKYFLCFTAYTETAWKGDGV